MAARERIEPRIDIAKRRARARLAATARTDRVGLILAGGEAELLEPLSYDRQPVDRAIGRTQVFIGPGDLEKAVNLACGLLPKSPRSSVVIISDGSEPLPDCPGVSMEPIQVGTTRANVGITAFQTGVAPGDLRHAEAFAELTNASASPVDVELRLDLDGSLIGVAEMRLDPGAREHRIFEGIPFGGAGHLIARLGKIQFRDGSADALAEDNVAFALVSRPQKVPLRFVGESPALQMVLQANPRYAVQVGSGPSTQSAVNVIVGEIQQPLTDGAYLLVAVRGPGAPASVGSKVEAPHITYWHDEHPILRRVVLSDVLIAEAWQTTLPSSASSLAGSKETPLIYAMTEGARRIVGLTFDVDSSNLPLRVGFPVLVYNAIDWLIGTPSGAVSEHTIATHDAVEIIGPGDRRSRVEPVGGQVRVRTDAPGFYEARALGGGTLAAFAANLTNRGETMVSPVEQRKPAPFKLGRFRDREFATWLLLGVLAIAVLEWIAYHRRITV
jgi:hypothetical protein